MIHFLKIHMQLHTSLRFSCKLLNNTSFPKVILNREKNCLLLSFVLFEFELKTIITIF